VLDLACGKGGDLGKWALHPRGISNYVGIDVARGSLRDAAVRARAPNLRPKLPRCTFTCADLGSDVPGRPRSRRGKGKMQRLLTWSLQDEPPHSEGPPEFRLARGGGVSPGDRFDAVSIQFAIHYMMSSRYAFSFFASFARRDGWNIPSQVDVWTCEI
jgi:mRNA (guanine-N7-)-methyltransferase